MPKVPHTNSPVNVECITMALSIDQLDTSTCSPQPDIWTVQIFHVLSKECVQIKLMPHGDKALSKQMSHSHTLKKFSQSDNLVLPCKFQLIIIVHFLRY